MMGHVHTIDPSEMVTIGMADKALKECVIERAGITTGSMYRTYIPGTTNYAEICDYPPLPIGCGMITIAPWEDEGNRLHAEKLWLRRGV
jgi:hypothetical protein